MMAVRYEWKACNKLLKINFGNIFEIKDNLIELGIPKSNKTVQNIQQNSYNSCLNFKKNKYALP